MTRLHLIVILGACAATLAAGCARKPQPVVALPAPAVVDSPAPASPAPPPAPATASTPLTEEEIYARKSLEELNAERPLGHVFFDYDSATLRPADLSALQANAAWLSKWTTARITIEGHCDSRGTPEYNLALGDLRATAARSYLASLGVSPDRVTAVTKGKEQPFCNDENDDCWAQNRRGHFVITAK